ncbi:NTP transferase domain-containing protein [Hymenobacter sp. AT01-02]|uniref:nucleotidyltransferase family protein n=1 Tax=Hymenobacter sp. AT01-02 TaxID=1571877 RepID=UPI0005F0FC07|nr:nucleotidyltransferase family protein [Hymenobacter sp. AT01-02]
MPAILLLAAGSSSRLGRPKQLLRFQGNTLLRRAAETSVMAAAGLPVVVVTGALHQELLPELAGLPITTVHCPAWAEGMGASMKCGLAELEKLQPAWTEVLVLLCDQPHVTPDLLKQFSVVRAATGLPIAASQYSSTTGVPALFGREALPLLLQLPNDAGAGQLLKHRPDLVATVPFPAGVIDVDTEAQYAELLAVPAPVASPGNE